MRAGETDPEVLSQRKPEPIAWHNYVAIIATITALIASVALQWGVFNATLTSQQHELTSVEASQNVDHGRISELAGQSQSIVARIGQLEGEGIPEHLSKLDAFVAAINQQQIDQKAQSDRAHDERIKWQDAMSLKIDTLIASVAHLEGQKERAVK